MIHQRQAVSLGRGGPEVERRGDHEVKQLGFGEKIIDKDEVVAVASIPAAIALDDAANRIRLLRDQLHDKRDVVTVADGSQETGDQIGPILAAIIGIENAGGDDAGQLDLVDLGVGEPRQ